jgi:hypothetical protein
MKTYLDDSVYVDITRYGEIELTTENGISVTNRIYMDLPLYKALQEYIDVHTRLVSEFAYKGPQEEERPTTDTRHSDVTG